MTLLDDIIEEFENNTSKCCVCSSYTLDQTLAESYQRLVPFTVKPTDILCTECIDELEDV